ncbi:MAG TPA: BsuPI-related putative proteinase inhibitor [Bryobacteraceae bacterium]|nr:BsuPI-related putative proteinase inhibitor [Bryobacteraceae bacterium]
MRLRQITFALITLIGLAPGADFFPLRTGNTWTYRNSNTGESFSMTVGLPVVMNDRVYNQLRGYVDQPVFVRLNEQNDLIVVNDETFQEQPLTSFTSFDHGWWEAPSRTCLQQGRTSESRGLHDGPAGPFHDVLEVTYRTFSCADIGTESEQYAENIGMVRRVNTTIAGPREFDLVYAKVGNIEIDARQHSSFAISVDQNKPAAFLTATLRVQTNSAAPLKLRFATAQEYDVVLRDDSGKEVWKWSDGQVFAQVEHDRSIAVGWTTQVQIPVPQSIGNNAQPAVYTLQAWLTAEGSDPYYAAAVPVTIAF